MSDTPANATDDNQCRTPMIQIDGIIYTLQRRGGISVYASSLVEHMSRAGTELCLSVDGPVLQADAIPEVSDRVERRAPRLLERYRSCRLTPNATLFHSIYYRKPAQRKIPTVVTVYDFVYERYVSGARRWVHTTQKNAAIRAADAVICISQATRDDLLEFVGEIPGQHVAVTHLGVSDIFKPLGLPAAARPYVLFVGERRGYKNFATLAAAMQYLPDIELRCVGGGAMQAEELAGLSDATRERIRHLGFVDDEALNRQYNTAVCLAYPSRYEGFGIPILEAMRAGCPVISTRCKAVMEVGQDALVVTEDEPRAMADSILRLMADDQRHLCTTRGLQIAAKFSWKHTHEQTMQVYRLLGETLGH